MQSKRKKSKAESKAESKKKSRKAKVEAVKPEEILPVTSAAGPVNLPQMNILNDGSLLESCRTQWQYGEWDTLAEIDLETISNDRDRAKLAALLGSVASHLGRKDRARAFLEAAREWGATPEIIARLLISGVVNSLGRACVAADESDRAQRHFQDAISIVEPKADANLIARTRSIRQAARMGLLTSAQERLEAE